MPGTCTCSVSFRLLLRVQELDRADSLDLVPRATHSATEAELALAAVQAAVADAAAAEHAAADAAGSSAATGPAAPKTKLECALCITV